jgi:hypothetical protein
MQQYNQDFNQVQQPFPANPTPSNYQGNSSYNQNPQFPANQNYNSTYPSQPSQINNSIKQPIKSIKPKQSIFSLKNILIAVLSLYSIFSFVWIAILYLGVDGSKICLDDNIFCKISVPFTKQAAVAINNNVETKNQLVKQKSAKNFVKDIWQDQAIANDTLVTRQQSVEKSVGSFLAYIQNYIRVVDDKPEFLKGFSKTELDNKKTEIEQQLENLKLLQDSNYQSKISNQKRINELYQELGERQDNSFVAQR